MSSEWYTLPNGVDIVTRVFYTPREARGPLALALTSSISLCAVLAILVGMAISGFKTRHQFVRSQVGAYFLSLVISDLLQATGSLMNVKWVIIQGVSIGPFCTTQAALKQSGNVGTALWSLVIAIHTFCLLFLRLRIGDHLFYAILIGVWLFIALVVMMGPVLLQNAANGPFWGISGYWCWITNGYRVEQLTDEYLFMFLTAGTSFVLYSLIFFRLRGNIQGFGRKLRFCRVKQPWVQDEMDESQMSTAGKQMLWYPVAYTIIIFPISICRWSSLFGHDVPYWATMTSDSIFMLSGFVNAILYSTTRKIVSIRAVLPFSHLISIGPSRRFTSRGSAPSKPYLDTMEFAIPVPTLPNSKAGTYQSSMISTTSRGRWHSRSTDYVCEDKLPPSELWKIDSTSEGYDSARYSEGHSGHGDPQDPVTTPPPTSVCVDHGSQHIDHRMRPPNLTPCPVDTSVMPNDTSQVSLTTDDAPSLHHKRFSGWSLPSMNGGRAGSQRSLEGQESMRTELEEMQFAPPSPEPFRNKPLPSPSHKWPLPTVTK